MHALPRVRQIGGEVTDLTRREVLKGGAAGAAALGISALGFDVAVAKATTV